MSDAQLFQFANTAALVSWIVLIVQPRRMAPLLRFVVPVLMAVLYIWALATAPANPDGGFGSLAQVKALFSQDRAVLAGWVHYLAFDMFVGCWEVMDAQQRGVHQYPWARAHRPRFRQPRHCPPGAAGAKRCATRPRWR